MCNSVLGICAWQEGECTPRNGRAAQSNTVAASHCLHKQSVAPTGQGHLTEAFVKCLVSDIMLRALIHG